MRKRARALFEEKYTAEKNFLMLMEFTNMRVRISSKQEKEIKMEQYRKEVLFLITG
jgi:hypothetical protein